MKDNNEGRLTIISLPIGNLKDITIRALEELESSDLIFCEDTRTTIKLLNHYNIKNKLMSYHEHSDVKTKKFIIDEWAPYYIEGLSKGEVKIKLELIDKSGNLVDTPFNPSERIVILE